MADKLSPEILNKWARSIAVEVDPAREALAPMMVEAYLRGGRQRRQLFESVDTPGGFLPEGAISLLPYAFLALSWVANELMHLARNGGLSALSDLLSCWKSWLELAKARKALEEEATSHQTHSEALDDLNRVLTAVQRALEKQGLPIEQCELVTYRVMKVLVQEPNEAAQVVKTFHGKDR